MAIDFDAISEENWVYYGTKVSNYGPRLLADLYAERTHFIFELLQNAEDALRRRVNPPSSAVAFEISERALAVRHFGEPFNEADVRSICGIAESTKELTDIGRFGIGFKSVYAWTDRPEIHSGGSDFAIENYVHPMAASEIERAADETVIIIPFKEDVADLREKISEALAGNAHDALRFLREIDEIEWQIDGELAGHYLREREALDQGVDRVAIVGGQGENETESSWLVFSDPVEREGKHVGHVEIALAHKPESAEEPAQIRPVDRSLLSAYFPTALETQLGFLTHGPYRTTPARDNVPPNDKWNVALVAQTATLLKRSLPWLRDHGYLTPTGLECLPIDPVKFDEANMFSPLFDATKDALVSEPLLPTSSSDYVSARHGVLGGTGVLRKLFQTEHIAELLESSEEVAWLSSQITQSRTPGLYIYLRDTLETFEVGDAWSIMRKLSRSFFAQQTDEWIRTLYVTLKDQAAMHQRERFAALPIVRLEDGSHVEARREGELLAYLPTSADTGYPTVRRAVCDMPEAREFLEMIGLREPDLIDDMIDNVLPAYETEAVPIDDEARYTSDLQRLADAYQTNSASRRGSLAGALRRTRFVKAVDAESGECTFRRPATVYAPTDELRRLFGGVRGVWFLDRAVQCFENADVKTMLDACGVSTKLRARQVTYDESTSADEWAKLSRAVQMPRSTRGRHAEDHTLLGFPRLLRALPSLSGERQREAASALWICLGDLADADNARFDGSYRYFYYTQQVMRFPSRFVRALNTERWVPTDDGDLAKPEEVMFESLGWTRNQFLEERIQFKEIPADPIVELAQKADVDPGVLALAKEHGLTESELKGMLEQRRTNDEDAHGDPERRTVSRTGQTHREFRSYVHVGRDEPAETDSEAHAQLMALEAASRQRIRAIEPEWIETKEGNHGFDLYQTDADGETVKWCEVKSLSGGWDARSVTMSDTQFKLAQEKGGAYWLYVVEYAGDPARINLVRIQDPAGRAKTFTFDDGWGEIAETDDEAG